MDTGPVMSRTWWWEAVSTPVGKESGTICAHGGRGETAASVPYQVTKRGPFAALLLPQLTQTSHMSLPSGQDGRGEALKSLIGELKRFMAQRLVVMAQVADYMTE